MSIVKGCSKAIGVLGETVGDRIIWVMDYSMICVIDNLM